MINTGLTLQTLIYRKLGALYISAEISVELGRSIHMNFNLENVEELTEFIDGLVLSGEENLVADSTKRSASGRTLFLRSFNLCTTEMFFQLEVPPVLARPKLLGSVLGIEAKASLRPDLQGKMSVFCWVAVVANLQ